jgi:hypothetical protein
MTFVAGFLSAVLLAIAALHAYWGVGGLWPAASAAELARTVVGDGRTRMPAPWSCFAVAILLVLVALWPWLLLSHPVSQPVLAVGVVFAAVFLIRGLAGYSPRWRARFSAEPFATRDRRLYSPLCMVLATGFMVLLSREM